MSQAQLRAFRICPVMPSSHPPRTMQVTKGIWPRASRARPSVGLFHSDDMLFTRASQNGAQITLAPFKTLSPPACGLFFVCDPLTHQSHSWTTLSLSMEENHVSA